MILFAAAIIVLLPLYQLRFAIAGIPLTALEVAVVAFTVIVIVREYRAAWSFLRDPHTRVVRMIAFGFLVLTTAALFWTPALRDGLGIWKAYCVEPVLFAFALSLVIKKPKDITVLLQAAWALVIVVSVVAIYQYITGAGIPEPWNAWPDRRAVGVFSYPNAVGLLLAPIIASAVAYLVHRRFVERFFENTVRQEKLLLFLAITATILGSIAVVCARADGAVIAIVGSAIVMLLFTRARFFTLAVSAIGLVLALALPQTREILLFRDVSGDVRLALWKGTWNLISHQAITGAGIAAFPQVYDLYRLPSHVELLEYSHNLLFDFWTQFGIFGAIWICVTIGIAVKCLYHSRLSTRNATLVLLAPIIAICVYGIVDVPYFKNDLALLFWTWLAVSYKTLLLGLKK